MVRKNVVIFDVDGTLLDIDEYIFSAYEYTIEAYQLSKKTRNELIDIIRTKPLDKTYIDIADSEDYNKYLITHRQFLKDNLHLVQPYEKTIDMLKFLKNIGIKIAFLPNRKSFIHEALAITNIDQYADIIVTKDQLVNPKPNPEGIRKILSFFDMQPSEAIMIGDTDIDISAGKNAGIETILIQTNITKELEKKHEPDFVIDNIFQVTTFF